MSLTIRENLSREGLPSWVSYMLPFLLAVCPLHAQEISSQQNRLKGIRSEIKITEQTISKAKHDKTDIQAELKRTEKTIGYIGRRLHIIRQDYEIQQKQYEQLQGEVLARENALHEEQQRLGALMRSAYQMDRHGELRMLLNQESPALFRRMLAYHDYFTRQRVRQIDAVNQRLAALNKARHELSLQTRALTRLQNSREQELKGLEKANEERQQTLALIDQDIDQHGKYLSQLRKDEQALAGILRSLTDMLSDLPIGKSKHKPFGQLRGQLNWPSAGQLITHFGTNRGDTGKKWSGVVIGTQRGSQVAAIARGRVAFSDWLRGYGLLIIIDHGDGYMSLYGHNESVYKDTGEWVETGEVVASVGDSGGQKRTGLYFEIRKEGQPLNPVRWCASGKPPAAG